MPTENQRGGPPGAGRAPERSGFGGRDGGRRDGGRDGGRKDRFEGGAGQRILSELSVLEKAISKGDLPSQKRPLDEVLKSLQAQRAKSLAQLDPNTKGRLITTLARVSRQPKPLPPQAAEPASESTPTEPAPAEASAPEQVEPPAEAAEVPAAEADPAAPEEQLQSGAPDALQDSPPPVAAPPAEDKSKTYADVLYRLALIWKVLSETDRFDTALALSGRTLDEADLARLDAPPPERAAGSEGRPAREGSKGRRERTDRPERSGSRSPEGRSERPARPPREALPIFPEGSDWKEQARILEEKGRTRDAGRIHERNASPADAARLLEAGGDVKGALRNAALAKDPIAAKRLVALLKPEEATTILEKADAYELLMELYVQQGQFEPVARLYERARQFDQAALAWERAGKLAPARKAFERAHDTANVERLRKLEVDKLIERGDRLGAAVILSQSGHKQEAQEILKTLPAPKQFRFLEKLKLTEEAQALARGELAKADEEKRPSTRARWLELLGDLPGAAQAWEQAERKDKAYPLHEKLGDLPKAAQLAEAAGHHQAAIGLYQRAGDEAGAARVQALPPTPIPATPPAAADEPPDEGAEPHELHPEAH